jgi:hypothetical protein
MSGEGFTNGCRLVVPYTNLRPETYRATRSWPNVTYRYVGDSDTAYAEWLSELWAEGEGFIVCEHDVEPAPGALQELADCEHGYCAFPVALSVYLAPCMSLTKFSGAFLREHPDVMERAMRVPTNHGAPGHYRQLDTVIQQTILLKRYGSQPHVHLPPARHLNPVKSLLVPDAPLRTWVDARFALPEPEEIAGDDGT